MQSSVLVSSFAEIAREKGIERDTLQLIIEDVFRAMIRKRYGSDDSFEIILNPDHGDMEILHIREILPDWDIEDPVTQIGITDALIVDADVEVGDEVAEEVDFKDFGRRAVMTARQTFSQRIRDIEKENLYEWYTDYVGEVIVGEIYQIRRREILVVHNKAELILPRHEQIYRDRYRKGDMVRAVIKEVGRDSVGNPQIIISRADPLFMERLFELEVPEIDEGIVEIKKIVREPGERAKVAVVSYDERIDPVGACVGMKGSRIHAVVRELGNENIDVVQWSDDKVELIKRALSPSNPFLVQLNDQLDPPRAKVVVRADEVSQAIGRGGINIRLASQLTGYEIDVYREISDKEEDVEIKEFADEIDADTLKKLEDIGCDTARAVLELSKDELIRRTGLDDEKAEAVLAVIRAEFEDAESEKAREAAAKTSEPKSDSSVSEEKTAEEAPAEQSEVDVDAETDAGGQTEAEAEAETEAGAEAEADSETKAEVETQAETKAETEAETEAGTEAEADSETKAEVETRSETEAETASEKEDVVISDDSSDVADAGAPEGDEEKKETEA